MKRSIWIAILTLSLTGAAYAMCGNCPGDTKKTATAHEHAAVYTCPMHADVTAEKEGQCPECGMDLVAAEHKH